MELRVEHVRVAVRRSMRRAAGVLFQVTCPDGVARVDELAVAEVRHIITLQL